MIEKFIETFAKALVDKPEAVRIEKHQVNDGVYELTIFTNRNDVGKIIGKGGKMVESIKVILSGHKAKQNNFFKINVRPNE